MTISSLDQASIELILPIELYLSLLNQPVNDSKAFGIMAQEVEHLGLR